jgi:hypothetical protein
VTQNCVASVTNDCTKVQQKEQISYLDFSVSLVSLSLLLLSVLERGSGEGGGQVMRTGLSPLDLKTFRRV